MRTEENWLMMLSCIFNNVEVVDGKSQKHLNTRSDPIIWIRHDEIMGRHDETMHTPSKLGQFLPPDPQ